MNRSIVWTINFILALNVISKPVYGLLAGGRPNAISGGQNAFAGVVNPANAVWIKDRFDVGMFIVHQKLTLENHKNNPFFLPGKANLSYHSEYLLTGDAAIHKRFKVGGYDFSLGLATYTTPGYVKVRTQDPLPIAGTTPIRVEDKTQVFSTIFSLKFNASHSIGLSLDYFYLTHLREGFQRSDNSLRSEAPGLVTNNGLDHSNGVGLSFGWRWNINKDLAFGFAYVKKSYVGQFKKYKGYEPHQAKNYIPTTMGGGFTYRFTPKMAGRLEVLWSGLGNLPNANNSVLSNGALNLSKHGSDQSSGVGLQDATFLNLGMGYQVNSYLSLGYGFSHRFKLPRNSPFINSHSYRLQTIYDIISFGVDFYYRHHEIFLSFSHGFPNHQSGLMPKLIGGGIFSSKKTSDSLAVAYGYSY